AENLVQGFHVGILVEDRAESGTAAARMRISNNQVVDCESVGILVAGDGVDVDGNEIRNTSRFNALFQAGIQVAGRALRVRNCWVTFGQVPFDPLGITAGVVVGDGMDDGRGTPRATYDVEVADNRVEGTGEGTVAVGILIGGPQPIYDVRVRGNVVRSLGDAAVRTVGTGGAIGRLRIEGNRFEQVALADLPPEADQSSAIAHLSPELAQSLTAQQKSRPGALIEALLASPSASVRALLDGALRWLEVLSLRGAVALTGVEECSVTGNRIHQVGRLETYGGTSPAEIRAAAIGVVGGREVAVEGNEISTVRAPVRAQAPSPGSGTIKLPPIVGVLDRLGLLSATARVDQGDVHAAVLGLRGMVLEYTGADDTRRQQLGRGMYGPLDALVQSLKDLGGTPASLASALKSEAAELRSAQGREAHTDTSNRVRSTLSQAASFTAANETSQDAWDTAAQFDLATVSGPEAVKKTVARLRGALGTLVHGLPESLRKQLSEALGTVEGAPDNLGFQVALSGFLGQVGALRDAQAQRARQAVIGELVGPKRTIVNTFAESALKQLPSGRTTRRAAETGSAEPRTLNEEVLGQLRRSKEALYEQLRETQPALATQLEADFRSVDRSRGEQGAAVTRLRSTLTQIKSAADGEVVSDAVVAEDAERIAAQGSNAAVSLFAATLDQQAAGLASTSEDEVEKNLKTFGGTLSQLVNLVEADRELSPL
ncbi:MAG TPA: hypothetical protein VEY30_14625, partial [Myxococcaceae bacterium]|nr:hypothetical protein [Myxococcaceae bacterium]